MHRDDDLPPAASPLDPEGARELLWRFAVQATEQAVLLLDPDGVVRWANAGAKKVLGDDAPVGRPVHTYFTPEDRADGIPDFELHVAASRGWVQDDRWMQRLDGSRFWATGTTNGVRADDGSVQGYAKVLRNQTHSKMQLERLRERAAHGKAAVATVAHELRNPLSAVAMAANVIEHGGYDAERWKAAVAILQNNVRLAARLVEDLMDSERGRAGKLHLQVGPVVLTDALRAAIAIACNGGDRRVELIPVAGRLVVQGDPLRLQQVFVNLVGNALRYTPESGRIWVTASREGTQALVEVADTGIGIAPHMLESIFDIFTQADADGAAGGLGIGLALVKQLVELHGGSVQAQSDGVGKGSKFLVRLPLARE